MPEIPEGLLFALEQDSEAMRRFAGLPESEKDVVLEGARRAKNAREIEHIVSRI